MKLIKMFINLFKSKKMTEKLTLLLLVAKNQNSRLVECTENADCADRLVRVQKGIDLLTEQLLDEVLPKVVAEKEVKTVVLPEKKEPVKTEEKKVEKPMETAPAKVEPAKVEPTKVEEVAEEGGPTEEDKIDEVTCEVVVLPPVSIKNKSGNIRKLKIDTTNIVSLTAFVEEEGRSQFGDIYPTYDELEDVLTEAWNMACACKSNKEINEYLIENIGKYYANLFKKESDWYKISNTYNKAVAVIKSMFGENTKDASITITRPYETEDNDELIFTKDNDLFKADATAKKPEVAKTEETAVEEPAEASTEEMKTVQEPQDEQQQEEEDADKTEETVEEEIPAETAPIEEEEKTEEVAEEAVSTDTVDFSTPPLINSFENFNELEEAIFDILDNANKKQKNASLSDAEKKTIRIESRDEVKLYISIYFSDYSEAEWAVQGDDGSWSTEFISYVAGLTKICSENYSK